MANHRGSGSTIRPYQPNDRDSVTEICVRTAAGGQDARGIYSDDMLMPEVYCLPYVTYAPDLAWVVDDGGAGHPAGAPAGGSGGVVGYVVAVADTREFVDWYETEWAPGFRARHPRPGPMGRDYRYTEEALVRDGGDPGRMLRGITPAELADHPAHLHIDLLPEGQRRGLGRRLLDTLRAALAERGVPGVHLGMDPANTGARAFYDAYGFHELPSHRPDTPLLGIRTR
ncbi:GNAT family N-acetyltransferase [Myceligenerans sp. TRM 65318]|uniref:GNAT family N-acetyltransferase n=1 Tax=Myceligenerans pegani TaxID=2776917 RepID=A0ABR9MU67_9MICO|nr:GNAT family N-acetyltransferase [Myceligenerans sp. TRM 65318]MBE3017176.1 GNAT family N-acetyltransferase [Myceligenerans sp. TRM 65318]